MLPIPAAPRLRGTETEEGRMGGVAAACRARAATFLPQDARRLSRRVKERANAGASSLHAEGSAGGTIETVPRGGEVGQSQVDWNWRPKERHLGRTG